MFRPARWTIWFGKFDQWALCFSSSNELMPGVAFDEQEWRAMDLRPQRVVLFLLLYYIMTLIHAFHLIVGIALVSTLAVQTQRGWFTARYTPAPYTAAPCPLAASQLPMPFKAAAAPAGTAPVRSGPMFNR